MNDGGNNQIESEAATEFARVMSSNGAGTPARARQARLDLSEDNVKNGLGQLVLTLIKLLHELLERQAMRRIDGGSLSDDEIERLGVTLMKQAEEIGRLKKEFGLSDDDLNVDLGPIGTLL
jgi:hypothetical protein